ncbi:MAG: ABC transporter ATP-binding protein [Caldilineaceae bacterium]|nr:ABC transporter ATP-binding protein [Caldilineaceae bacterium]
MLNTAAQPTTQAEFDLKQTVGIGKLRGFWRLMTGFRGTYLVSTVSMGIAAIMNTVTFLLLRYFVDHYMVAGDRTIHLAVYVAGFLTLAVIQAACTFNSRRLAAKTAEGIARRIREYLFDHIQRLSFTYHDKTQTGELIQRATSDVDTIRRFFADQAIEAGRIVMLFIVNFAAIYLLDWRLAWFSIIVVPVVMVISLFFFRRVEKAYEAYQEQEAKLSSTLQENLSGVRVVKAFARQEYEEGKFDDENKKKYARGRYLLLMHALFWPITDVMCGAQMLSGFLFAGWLTINGEITVGTYVAYAGLVVWIIWPLRNLGRLIVQMSESLVSFGRVSTVVVETREPVLEGTVRTDKQVKGEITFEDVHFAYVGTERSALRGVSFTVKPGQSVALIGGTGSGKSSLVNLLPRFYDYTGGRVLLDGVELTEYARHYLRSQIGIVEQEPFLFSRTVRDNITYGVTREVPDAEVEEAARAAAIHDVILNKLPHGYETLVGERGITLSGGQKQRVAIARTLLKDPRILILDDSTSAVDFETEAEIRQALRRLMKGRTTFIIAHRIQSVMDADLILVLEHGRVIQRGTHDELVQQEGTYRRIYLAQTRLEAELEEELSRD